MCRWKLFKGFYNRQEFSSDLPFIERFRRTIIALGIYQGAQKLLDKQAVSDRLQ